MNLGGGDTIPPVMLMNSFSTFLSGFQTCSPEFPEQGFWTIEARLLYRPTTSETLNIESKYLWFKKISAGNFEMELGLTLLGLNVRNNIVFQECFNASLTHFILTLSYKVGTFYYPHFTDEEA